MRRSSKQRHATHGLRVVCMGYAALASTSARGSDASLPRTPVVHLDAPCMTVVERSGSDPAPVVHFDYTIPFSDTCVTSDEAPGSRTHQFLALCRVPEPLERVPSWISTDDVNAALESGALMAEEAPSSDDVLALAPAWDGCWTRISADDDRRAIHCSDAQSGVDWNIADVPSGAYVVYGYTYQPPINTWTRRSGVVKVTSPGEDPPAVALYQHAPHLGDDAPLALRVCVDAPSGSRMTASWAIAGDEAAQWTSFFETTVTGDGDVAVPLQAPADLPTATSLWVMVEVLAGAGQSFRYVSPDPVVYLGATAPPWSPPETYDYCKESGPAALEPQRCPGMEASDGGDDNAEPGCGGCRQLEARPWSVLALLFPFFAAVRPRRRRAAHGSAQA